MVIRRMHPSHTHCASQEPNGSVEACVLIQTHMHIAYTQIHTQLLPVFLLWLPWAPIENVIDRFSETGGAFRRANLHCLLQDNSPHWTCECVRKLPSSPSAKSIMVTINDVCIAHINFSCRTTATAWQQRWTRSRRLCTKTTVTQSWV